MDIFKDYLFVLDNIMKEIKMCGRKKYIYVYIYMFIYDEKSYRIGHCQRILLIFSLRSKRIPHSFNTLKDQQHTKATDGAVR